ncbi:conjugative transposon protein TraN [Salmonirosea aquatica]
MKRNRVMWKTLNLFWTILMFGQGGISQIAGNDSIISNSAMSSTYLRTIEIEPHPFILPIAKASVRGSYPIELSYSKTTHIIFPSKIQDFDAGSDVVIATVPEKLLNVLRVKSDAKGFSGETNMTVFTDDGGLFSFLIRYNDNPEVFNINISNNIAADNQATHSLGIGQSSNNSPNTYLMEEGGYLEQSLIASSLEVLVRKDFIRQLGARKSDMNVLLKGIFLDENNVLYLKLNMKNKSLMPYQIDFIKVFVRDKNHIKRMAAQDNEISVLMDYPMSITHLNGLQNLEKVIAIPNCTLADGKTMEIEIYEKAGGRHLKFQLGNDTLLKVKRL